MSARVVLNNVFLLTILSCAELLELKGFLELSPKQIDLLLRKGPSKQKKMNSQNREENINIISNVFMNGIICLS